MRQLCCVGPDFLNSKKGENLINLVERPRGWKLLQFTLTALGAELSEDTRYRLRALGLR